MSWSDQFKKKLIQIGLLSSGGVDEQQIASLETLLLESDVGVVATDQICATLRQKIKEGRSLRQGLQELLSNSFTIVPRTFEQKNNHHTEVWLILGVNGVGKTTSIGKLARFLQTQRHKVLLAAGDTFRAAASDQLSMWAQRNNSLFVSNEQGDPASIIFDAIQMAKARQIDIALIDTAGRLPTQAHLIEELKKVQRVANKALIGAPHERILVVDATTGQNMLAQIRAFDAAVQLTGLIITKIDGSAKGGALLAFAFDSLIRHIPIYFVGLGEGIDDLAVFHPERFINSFLPSVKE